MEPNYNVGDWVKDTASGAYGVVGAVFENNQYSVKWGGGQENKESGSNLTPSGPTMYFQAVRSFAEMTLGMDMTRFDQYAEFAKKEMTLEAIAELEGHMLDFTPADPDAEANYEATWETIEQTAADQPADEDDIFGAFDDDPKLTDAPAEDLQSVSTAETVAAAAETPAGKKFIAFQKDVIWGVGSTFDEALADGTKQFKEFVKRSPEMGELKVSPASGALVDIVEHRGGSASYWPTGYSWKLGEDIAVLVTPELSGRVTTGEDPYHEGEIAVFVDGEIVEQHFKSVEEAQAAVPDWEAIAEEADAAKTEQPVEQTTPALNKQAMCAMCGNVKVNKSSPTLADGSKVCKKCELKSKASAIAMTEEPAPKPGNGSSEVPAKDAESDSVGEPCSDTIKSAGTATDAPDDVVDFGESPEEPFMPFVESRRCNACDTFLPPENFKTTTLGEFCVECVEREGFEIVSCESEQIPTPPPAVTEPPRVRTDAGLIDPETGEVLEESFIMRKFGWTEFPELSAKPTREELDAYEAKLDQVTDRVLGYLERTARYRAAAELRCKDLDGAARFYQAAFIEPMARALAVHRLPRFKSGAKVGEYSKKTMVLNSGAVKFTQTGGFYVHNKEEVRAAIEKQGIENFKNIDAKEVISYDHNKLMSALKAGTLKDFPGTGKKPVNPLASVKLVSPALPPSQDDESEDEE